MKYNLNEYLKPSLIIITGVLFTGAFCLTTAHSTLHIAFSVIGALVFGKCAYHRDDSIAFMCCVPMIIGFSFIIKAMEVVHNNSVPALIFGSLFLFLAVWVAFDKENFRMTETP